MSADWPRLFAALGDPTRLQLVQRLAHGEVHSIRELSSGTSMSRQAVTKHLRVLEDARLVRSIRNGREVRFRLEQKALADAEGFLRTLERQWERALARISTRSR